MPNPSDSSVGLSLSETPDKDDKVFNFWISLSTLAYLAVLSFPSRLQAGLILSVFCFKLCPYCFWQRPLVTKLGPVGPAKIS